MIPPQSLETLIRAMRRGEHASEIREPARVMPVPALRPVAGNDEPPLALSSGGQLLRDAMGNSRPPQVEIPAAPLVAMAEMAGPDLAAALARAVATSGIFYEAHLGRLLRHQGSMAELAQEPQAGWSPAAFDARADEGADPARPSPIALARALLNRQLDVLETGRFVWAGSLWPGQPATLTISEYDAPSSSAHSDSGAAASWQVRLLLDCPPLGAIGATIVQSGDSVAISVLANAAAGERLAGARSLLAANCAAQSLALGSLNVAVGCATDPRDDPRDDPPTTRRALTPGNASPVGVREALAAEIIRHAHTEGRFVHNSRELVALLMQIDFDDRIPPALYRAVAAFASFVLRVAQHPSVPG